MFCLYIDINNYLGFRVGVRNGDEGTGVKGTKRDDEDGTGDR